MVVLNLSVRQRINIEGIVRSQRVEDNAENLELLIGLRKKIGFTDEERAPYVLVLPNGELHLKPAADKAEIGVYELETAEVRKIALLLKDLKYSTDDAELWYFDLRDQLKAALKR